MNAFDKNFFQACFISGMVSDLADYLNSTLIDEQKLKLITTVEETYSLEYWEKRSTVFNDLTGPKHLI